jgi:hypothetical protein
MAHPPPKTSLVIDYASTLGRRPSAGGLLVWLMPLWCFAILMPAYVLGMGDDPFWYAAMGLPLVVALRCAWMPALYCVVIACVVTAVAVLLPSLNRAT